MKPVEPSRRLAALTKPLKYVPASHTDVRATFDKFRRLQSLQAALKGETK